MQCFLQLPKSALKPTGAHSSRGRRAFEREASRFPPLQLRYSIRYGLQIMVEPRPKARCKTETCGHLRPYTPQTERTHEAHPRSEPPSNFKGEKTHKKVQEGVARFTGYCFGIILHLSIE